MSEENKDNINLTLDTQQLEDMRNTDISDMPEEKYERIHSDEELEYLEQKEEKKKKGKKAKLHKIIFLDAIIKLAYGAYLILALSNYVIGGMWAFFGLILLYLTIHWRKKRIMPFILTILIVLNLFASIGIMACGSNKDTSKADVVVVPGYKLENDQMSDTLKYRLDKAIEYYHGNPSAYFIVTGGVTKGNTISQATLMKSYLIAQGIPEELIIVEDQGTNIVDSIDLVHTYMAKTDKVTVISSVWQLVRVKELLRSYGIYAKGLAAECPYELIPNELFFEKLGILYAIVKVR